MSLSKLWGAWERFWFDEGSPLPVALCRIFFGVLVLLFFRWVLPDVDVFFGNHSIISAETAAAYRGHPQLDLLDFLPKSDLWLHLLMALLAVAGLGLTFGFFSRTSALVAALIILTLNSRGHFALHTGHSIMTVMLFYLSLSRCGEALSVDRLLRRRRQPDPEPGPVEKGSVLGQRLIQVQLAIVYWSAFAGKLQGDTWVNGTAVYYATHQAGFVRFPFPYLFDQLWACRLLSWGTLAVEFSLAFLVWVREIRYVVLAAGAIFHLVLDLVLVLPLFEYVMLACYVCFVDADDLLRAGAWAARFIAAPLSAVSSGARQLWFRLANTLTRPVFPACWPAARKQVLAPVLLVYLVSAFVAASPPSAFTRLFSGFPGRVLDRLGLASNFGVFAPEPQDYNQQFEAVITFADGSKKRWVFPRLSQGKRQPGQMEQKFFWSEWQMYFMAVPARTQRALFRDAAKYVAWLHRNQGNQPVHVSIYRTYSMITVNTGRPQAAPAAVTANVFDYPVAPEDLQ